MSKPKNWKPRRLPVLAAGKRYSGYVRISDGEPFVHRDEISNDAEHADIFPTQRAAKSRYPRVEYVTLIIGRQERVDGYVACDRHGGVHRDMLDPYGQGPGFTCRQEEHRPIYVDVKAGK